MRSLKSFVIGLLLAGLVATMPTHVFASGDVKLEGTRFTMNVPSGWAPGYRDLDNLLMPYFKDPKSGAVFEGVYLRGNPPEGFTLADFKKARIAGEDKRYTGKDHKVEQDKDMDVGGGKGRYLLAIWSDGGKSHEKHTALHLAGANRYLVVLWGEKGKIDKAVFDAAVKSFALAK